MEISSMIMFMVKSGLNTNRKLFPDSNYHILALDIIYTSQTYNFYEDMNFAPINAQARKLYFERVAKAKSLADAVEKAKADMDLLAEAQNFTCDVLAMGKVVKHRAFGEGTVSSFRQMIVSVFFPKLNETKHLGLATAIENGLITLATEEDTLKLLAYMPILKKEKDLPKTLVRTVEELQSYLEYLD